jgi:hypothetical protein
MGPAEEVTSVIGPVSGVGLAFVPEEGAREVVANKVISVPGRRNKILPTGTSRILHASLGGGPAQYMFFFGLAPTTLGLALVVWAVSTRSLSDGLRRTTMAAAILIAVGGWACVRTAGVTNDLKPELHWRRDEPLLQ